MPVPTIDPALRQALEKRGWFLRAERNGHLGEFVYLYVDESRGGHPIGYAQERGGYWQTWALVRPHAMFGNDEIGLYPSIDAALRAILGHALF